MNRIRKLIAIAGVVALAGCVTAKNYKRTEIEIAGVGKMTKEVNQEIPWLTNVARDQDTEVAIVKTIKEPDGKTTATLAISYREITRIGVDQGAQERVTNNFIETAGALIGAYIGYAFGSVPGAVGGAVVGDKVGEAVGDAVTHSE